jgi:hypothetical protein
MPKAYSLERDDGVPDKSETRSLQPHGISTSGVSQDMHDVSVDWVPMLNSLPDCDCRQGRKFTARLKKLF